MHSEVVAIEDRGYDYLVYSDGRIKCYDSDVDDYVLMERYIRTNGTVGVIGKCGEQRLWCSEHSMVAKAFLGPKPSRNVITHRDKNKGNNHVDNLFYLARGKAKKRRGFYCELV